MQASCRWGYFDSSNLRPLPTDPLNVTSDKIKAMEWWDYNGLVTQYLLSQRLPNSTAVHVGPILNARLRWDWVQDEFIAKSIYVQNDLETAFYDMRCLRGGDVQTFLTSLRYKHEEIAAAGVRINNKDYQCMVLRGIPEELVHFASSILLSRTHIFYLIFLYFIQIYLMKY